jgi:hypothetical protein
LVARVLRILFGGEKEEKTKNTDANVQTDTLISWEEKKQRCTSNKGQKPQEKQEETKTHWSKQRKKVKREPGKHLSPKPLMQ